MKKRNKVWRTTAVAILSVCLLAACAQKPEENGVNPTAAPNVSEPAVKPSETTKSKLASDVIMKTMVVSSKLESFSVKMNTKQTIEQAAGKMDLQAKIDMDLVMKPQMSFKQSMTMNMMGQDMKMDSYFTKDGFFMKEPTSGQWMKLPREQMDQMMGAISEEQLDPSKQLEKLKPFANDFALTESNDDYTVKLSAGGDKFNEFIKKEMKSYLGSSPELDQLMNQGASSFKISNVEYTFTIDKKTQFPKSMKVFMDMEMDVQGQKMRIVQNLDGTYTNFNGIKEIVLPKEALEAKSVGAI